MSKHVVELIAGEGIFRGLAKQNMLFHQCISELVDNGLAAARTTSKSRISIVLVARESQPETVDVYISDNGKGMDLDTLKAALQLGQSAKTENRLNEHGFGLKNSLATLSGGNGKWKLFTKSENSHNVLSVAGPFNSKMEIEEVNDIERNNYLPTDISTLIHIPVKLSFLQTVQGRGAPAKDLFRIRAWLIEHLGVLYRGFLELNKNTDEPSAIIEVAIGNNNLRVPAVQVPMSRSETKYIEVELGGNIVKMEYRFGTLDEEKRDHLIRDEKAQFYYQGNIPTQGIDIRLDKRTIATKQFETIWVTETGTAQLTRHNNYNDFVGELIIPDLPRGVLTTVNNKTDFNLDDPDWRKIFSLLNSIRPPRQIREASEAALKKKWMAMLKATNPEDDVNDETAVWPQTTYIDVYRKTPVGKIVIFELKVGVGVPAHLYQLKMYWDGLVLYKNESPTEANLICEDFNGNLESMANMMNTMPVPTGSNPYNFRLRKRNDLGL